MVKVKDSRNTEIKESKNNEQIVSEQNKDDGQPVYGDSDVDALRIKTTNKPDTSDSRNEQKRAHEQIVKSNNTNESIKEDIILEKVSDKADSENDDKIEDDKNITGEQSLNEAGDVTPSKAISVNDSDLESEDRTDPNANSDSKYATVSILSEMSKKAKEVNNDTQTTVSSKASQDQIEHGNKLIELIYEAMLSEIKSELFPQRPLFLLTADLEKIELEQALIYLNDMSVEKEAALLKEYLKYSEEDALNSWELDNRHERDSNDSNMFSDSGKLVLYERKGISTDLFSIERYVDELATEVDDKCKPKFLTDTFTPIKKDSMAMLNQLQNSDIGSYDHFETDLNSIAILPLEVYLELEKKRKSKENEESKSDYMGYEKEDIGSKSSKASKTKQKEKNLLKE